MIKKYITDNTCDTFLRVTCLNDLGSLDYLCNYINDLINQYYESDDDDCKAIISSDIKGTLNQLINNLDWNIYENYEEL